MLTPLIYISPPFWLMQGGHGARGARDGAMLWSTLFPPQPEATTGPGTLLPFHYSGAAVLALGIAEGSGEKGIELCT